MTETPLEAACDALKARAEARCDACHSRPSYIYGAGPDGEGLFLDLPHTCHGDLKAAQNLVGEFILAIRSDTTEAKLERIRLLAELDRLMGEEAKR